MGHRLSLMGTLVANDGANLLRGNKMYPIYTNNFSVLLVDNDIVELENLEIGFSAEGFNAESRTESELARDCFLEHRFDVAIVDLMMPGINGLQLARMIHEVHPEVIIVLMSAYHLSPIQLAKANTGVAGFVPKPFKVSDLIDFIKKKLENSATGAIFPASRKNGLGVPVDISKTA